MPNEKIGRLRGRLERIQVHKRSDTEYHVYNIEKKTSYVVLRSAGGTWYCNCPYATKGSRVGSGICKHLTLVLDKVNGCQSCGRNDKFADLKRESMVGPYLCAACRRGGL